MGWQITYETFRDMELAYGIGLILIYLLIVAQFGSYFVPLIIMPILLTIIGVAAMMEAFFILDDQYSMAWLYHLLSGILVSTMLTLILIPVLYFGVFLDFGLKEIKFLHSIYLIQ